MILEGWAQFESTGRIEDYLNYSRSCQAAGGAVTAYRAENGPSAGGAVAAYRAENEPLADGAVAAYRAESGPSAGGTENGPGR